MQFAFDPKEIICFNCHWFQKGLWMDEVTELRRPFCRWYERRFSRRHTFKNRCLAYRPPDYKEEEISLPVVRKLLE